MIRCDDRKIEGACTKDKWTDRKLRKLVSLYRKYPCLWQKDAKAYLDNRARHCAYRSIHNAMSPLECSFIEVMMKIRELRRMYVLELKKCLQAETVNCYYDSDCTWFHILHEFLYPYLDYDEAAELHDIPRILSSSNVQRCYKKRNDDKDSPNSSNARPEWEVPKNATADNLKESPTRIIECKSKKQEVHGTLRCCDSIESRKSIPLTILYDKKSEYYSKEGSSATDQEVSWTTESTCKKPNLSAVRKQSADEAKFKSRIEAEDEFDIFSRSVACQLKKMDRNAALKAQMEIQKILTERLIGPQTATETVITTSKILAPSNVDTERYVNPPYSIVKRNQNERTNKNVSNPVSTFKRTAAQLQQSLIRRPAGPNRSERIGTKRGPISPVVKTRRDGK